MIQYLPADTLSDTYLFASGNFIIFSLQNPPEKEIDAQGTSVTNKKDRKKEKAKDGKKEGSDDNENGDDYGMFHLLETLIMGKLITFGIRPQRHIYTASNLTAVTYQQNHSPREIGLYRGV